MKGLYITTPLYYVNDKPHIGTAYTTIMSDILTRYYKLFGLDCFFLTGLDEHGQKCKQVAETKKIPLLQHCNDMAKRFINTWEELNIEYDCFFRTTDPAHTKAVQKALQELYDKGDIYKNSYEGWYSVSEEIFYTEKDLVNGKTPSGNEVQKVSEEGYFFKMSQYQKKLIKYIQDHPHFIQPESRKNEALGFLKNPLHDLSISRPHSRLNWGIPLPFDTGFVTYVWFDALLNYAEGVGYNSEDDRKKDFEKWWNKVRATHIIGKDILIPHAIYWPTMLMALDLPLPKTIFAHGWILNKDNEKMSKSKGDVVNPLEMKNIFGVDALRYFLARSIHFGNDAPFSQELFTNCFNTELANNLGNVYSRVTTLIDKYFEGVVKTPENTNQLTEALKKEALDLAKGIEQDIIALSPSQAIEKTVHLLQSTNKYLEQMAPWKLVKVNLKEAEEVLFTALACLHTSAVFLHPVMPQKMQELLSALGQKITNNIDLKSSITWKNTAYKNITKQAPLFPKTKKMEPS